jgi:MSHA biogenesis protein MshE
LRQDPDVILVGEMRDQETVDIGLRAAITGHLVFSTLHTMNAIATVPRLVDMGAAGYMIASAVHGIIAQRLVRRLCEDCAQPDEPTPQQRAWLSAHAKPERIAGMTFRSGVGCTYCNLTGYKGRAAIYELLEIDRELADTIRRGDNIAFAELARSRPEFRSLRDAAIDLVEQGITSVEEAISVTSGVEENEVVVPTVASVSQNDIDSLLKDVAAETALVEAIRA